MSVQNFLEKISQRFNKDAAKDISAIYSFQVEEDGNNAEYFLEIKDQCCKVVFDKTENPNVTLKADKDTWSSIAAGELAPQMAFISGRLSVDGDFPLAFKLSSLFQLS